MIDWYKKISELLSLYGYIFVIKKYNVQIQPNILILFVNAFKYMYLAEM